MPIDPRELLPRSTRDREAARAVIALGYPAVAPVLPDLLEWLQDYNWPVARPIGEFLASIPEPMVPHIRAVLDGNDLIWKYWCIEVTDSPPLAIKQIVVRHGHQSIHAGAVTCHRLVHSLNESSRRA